MHDLKNILGTPVQCIAPSSLTADKADGTSVDLKEHEGCTILVELGAFVETTSASWAIAAYESDDDSTFTAVAAADLDGAFTAVDATADGNAIQKVHYHGSSRYVKVRLDVTGTSTLLVGATLLPSHPRRFNAI